MGLWESIYTALFLMAIVFVMIFGLFLCIKLFSFLMEKLIKTPQSE